MPSASELGVARTAGPIETTFRRTLVALNKKLSAENLGEEGFTSCLLGGLTCTFREVVTQVPSENGPIKCSWGNYSKSDTKNGHSEAKSGADFCLVVFDDEENIRLAMFQGKRANKAARPNTCENSSMASDGVGGLANRSVDIHQRPPKPKNDALLDTWRPAQAIVLARAATCLLNRKSNPASICGITNKNEVCPCNSNVDVDHTVLNWVHYLIYSDGTPSCAPLAGVSPEKFNLEKESQRTSNTVQFTKEQQTEFLNLIVSGLSGEDNHWLPMKFSEIKDRLPTLLSVMQVYVGDDRSGGGLALELGQDIPNVGIDFESGICDVDASDEPSASSLRRGPHF